MLLRRFVPPRSMRLTLPPPCVGGKLEIKISSPHPRVTVDGFGSLRDGQTIVVVTRHGRWRRSLWRGICRRIVAEFTES